MSKRASYREGVAWIALNDEPSDVDPDSVASYISTMLLADLFGKEPADVAKAIVRKRRQVANQEAREAEHKPFYYIP